MIFVKAQPLTCDQSSIAVAYQCSLRHKFLTWNKTRKFKQHVLLFTGVNLQFRACYTNKKLLTRNTLDGWFEDCCFDSQIEVSNNWGSPLMKKFKSINTKGGTLRYLARKYTGLVFYFPEGMHALRKFTFLKKLLKDGYAFERVYFNIDILSEKFTLT